jgi:hypothetical protein
MPKASRVHGPEGDVSIGTALSIAADLFGLLWTTLSELVGSAATATLLRRSVKGVTSRRIELEGFLIRRVGLEYRYVLPPGWTDFSEATLETLRAVIAELCPILTEMTGPVALLHLRNVPAFRDAEITFVRS